MDSFLDEPRCRPKPTPIIQEIETPAVPEVSLMFQNSRKEKQSIPMNSNKITHSYNAWKLRNQCNTQQDDSFLLTKLLPKENTEDKTFLTKKQVRFENPVQKYTPSLNYPIANLNITKSDNFIANTLENRETAVYNVETRTMFEKNEKETKNSQFTAIAKEPETFLPKPFEKLYISNIPNRELDLSFLEHQKIPCRIHKTKINDAYYKSKEISPKKTNYRTNSKIYSPNIERITADFQPSKISSRNFQIISPISEFKELPELEKSINENEKLQIDKQNSTVESDHKQTVSSESKQESNDSVTVNDLLSIIKMQNAQLQVLQSQVEKLVKLSEKTEEEKQKSKESSIPNDNQIVIKDQERSVENLTSKKERFAKESQAIICKEKQIGTSFGDVIASKQETFSKDGQKISVGLMTSFEFNFKSSPIKKKHKIRNINPVQDESSSTSAFYDHDYHKPQKKQEIINITKSSTKHKVVPNRANNETEYSLGSQEYLKIQEPPESPENSIHIDMQEYDTDSDDECSSEDGGWEFYEDILGQVNNFLENSSHPNSKQDKKNSNKNYNNESFKDASLERIKENALKQLHTEGFLQASGEQYSLKPNEVSFAVKQILMKYLPDDGLANVVTKNKHEKLDKRMPSDISVTAFKYMQQCNVRTNAQQFYGRKGKNSVKKSSRSKTNRSGTDPKILDITTLKQQPKFL